MACSNILIIFAIGMQIGKWRNYLSICLTLLLRCTLCVVVLLTHEEHHHTKRRLASKDLNILQHPASSCASSVSTKPVADR